ncbi:MAG TPA: M13 family metallopeptidase [Planctomycetota bacterium]|nr:M13 family metallopeptidase [Planctomycetota bacterium]
MRATMRMNQLLRACNLSLAAFGLSLAAADCASPPAREPRASGLVLGDMDLKADPAQDFYRYVNGGWLDANPVPADEASWGVFLEVKKRNELVLQQVLEAAATAPTDELNRKLGDFYAAGMDEAAIEAQDARPIEPLLAKIDALDDVAKLPALLADLHQQGTSGIFAISSGADLTDARQNIAFLRQGGMALPERDYYLRESAEAVALRVQYQEHIAGMFELVGETGDDALVHATQVVALETELARSSFGAVDFRDPKKHLNKISVADAQTLTPHFDWTAYLRALRLDPAQPVNLIAPDYFKRVDSLLVSRPVEEWRAYLRWHALDDHAEFLSRRFESAHFEFFGRTLGGAAEQKPRWQRVLDATGGSMSEVLGQAFVAKTFTPEAKQRCQKMVDELIAAFRGRIEKLAWMSEATRAKALAKLAAIKTKIGYPDHWRDWSGLQVDRVSYAANRQRARAFNIRYDLSKIGKPVDRSEFRMPAYLVNASYSANNNDITFPAGILQPPFFSADYDDALNYGAMGAVIGHELTHGFDDGGSQYDADGNLANWWTPEDRAEFERRIKIVEEQFSGYVAIGDLKLNGKLTLGENLADLGGLCIAYDALQRSLAGRAVEPIDGFTPAQRFFIAWARGWRTNYTDARLKLQVNTNPHSPGKFRAIGPLSNLDAFQQAFGLPDDAAVMRKRSERALVW